MKGRIAFVALLIPTSASLAAVQVAGFAEAMQSSMDRMDTAMMIAPTGNYDRDFAAMMIPHHQGAVDMAVVELRYGRDERLRRLAQGIIVEQQEEIAVMRDILADQRAAVKPN